METKKKKILFIVNPISGVRKNHILEPYIHNSLDLGIFDPSIEYTKKAGDGFLIAQKATKQGINYVVAVGGDGTINEVANGLTGTNTILGIIPFGSGNGLAHHLKYPTNVVSAIQIINQQKIKKIDTANINQKMFVSIAGVGFDARVAKKFAKSEKRGFFSYFKIVSKEYTSYREKKYKLTIDGKELETRALFISLANSNQFGYNTQISPSASIDDGLIDVCIVKKVPLIELPIVAHLLYWKQIDKSKYIEIIKAKEIHIEQSKNRTINLDGEPIKLGQKLHIKINPLSLNIIIP
jgi:YegS/Rv2252/BmrU family lipid kinase